MDKSIGVRIGTVAKVAGVPVETIRTWERRYGKGIPPLPG